jgi:hypothetical protein
MAKTTHKEKAGRTHEMHAAATAELKIAADAAIHAYVWLFHLKPLIVSRWDWDIFLICFPLIKKVFTYL